jgi:hypothetical protein
MLQFHSVFATAWAGKNMRDEGMLIGNSSVPEWIARGSLPELIEQEMI